MKVALTVWDGRISPVFDVCREALVLGLDGMIIVSEDRVLFDGQKSLTQVERLVSLGVKVLVCGAISEPLQRQLVSQGIEVIAFVAGEAAAVVEAYLSGSLPDQTLLMPGCHDRPRLRRRRRCGHGGPQQQNMN